MKHKGKIYSLKVQTFLLLECYSKETEILDCHITHQVSNLRNLERTFVRGSATFQEAGGMFNEFEQPVCVMYELLVAYDSVSF